MSDTRSTLEAGSDAKTGYPKKGFSLLEVIVAMAILTLGITAAISLFTAATAAHKRAIDRTHATMIAEHVFADVESALERGLSPEQVQTEPPLEEVRKNWPGYEVQILFYTVDTPNAADEILLEVRIYWRYRGETREQVFQQLITRATQIR